MCTGRDRASPWRWPWSPARCASSAERNPERFISARLRLPGVKRNGRGHRRAKRRPPGLPPPMFVWIRYDVADGVTWLPLLRVAHLWQPSHPSPRLALLASLFSTPWPYHTIILLTDMSGWSQPSRTERLYFVPCVVCVLAEIWWRSRLQSGLLTKPIAQSDRGNPYSNDNNSTTTSSSVEHARPRATQRRRGSCSSGKEPGTFHIRQASPAGRET